MVGLSGSVFVLHQVKGILDRGIVRWGAVDQRGIYSVPEMEFVGGDHVDGGRFGTGSATSIQNVGSCLGKVDRSTEFAGSNAPVQVPGFGKKMFRLVGRGGGGQVQGLAFAVGNEVSLGIVVPVAVVDFPLRLVGEQGFDSDHRIIEGAVRDRRIVGSFLFGVVVPNEVEFLMPGGADVGSDDLFAGGRGEISEGVVGNHDPFVGRWVGGRNPVSVRIAPDLDPFFQVVVEGLAISVFKFFPNSDDGVENGILYWYDWRFS